MSFPKIELELQAVKEEIHEINETIKQLVIQIQLINLTFESMLKPKQRKEYQPLEIRLPEKIIPQSDDEKYIQRYRERIIKSQHDTAAKQTKQITEGDVEKEEKSS